MLFEISHEERRVILQALFCMRASPHDWDRHIESELIRRLLEDPPYPPPTMQPDPAHPDYAPKGTVLPRAEHVTPPPAGDDADRVMKRNMDRVVEQGIKNAGVELACKPVSIKNYGVAPMQRLILQCTIGVAGSRGTEGITATCWKAELFDAVRARLNKPTVFYIQTKVREGKTYRNIVGIKS
jgi:hypothetical protein